jgi:Ser/Thr protein kinase RdoA (MazF antagonist)
MPRPTADTAPEFTAAAAAQVLTHACEAVGMSASGATPIRLGENALFHLPLESVVVRIARTMSYWPDAVNEVNVARWLSELAFPAAEVADIPQPIEVDRHPVTFWHFIPGRDGNREDIAVLGTVLRRLHSLPRPATFRLPDENILGRVESRIASAPVPSADQDFLLGYLRELRSELPHLSFPLKPAPTHGDAHSENIRISDGRAVLIDFERFAWGQPEWDLAMTATEYKTAGWWTENEYQRFVAAYGYDVMSWRSGFDVLRRVHELKMTTWLMQNINESAEIADEYHVRMATIRDGIPSVWRPF